MFFTAKPTQKPTQRHIFVFFSPFKSVSDNNKSSCKPL